MATEQPIDHTPSEFGDQFLKKELEKILKKELEKIHPNPDAPIIEEIPREAPPQTSQTSDATSSSSACPNLDATITQQPIDHTPSEFGAQFLKKELEKIRQSPKAPIIEEVPREPIDHTPSEFG